MGIWGPNVGISSDSKTTGAIANADGSQANLSLTPEQIGQGIQIGGAIYQNVSGSGGNVDSQGRRWCDGRPADAQIAAVLQTARADELQPFRSGWAKEPRGSVPLEAADPGDVGYWLWGHMDCKHSSSQGYADRDRMITLVQKYAPAGGLLTPYPTATGGLPPAGNGQPSVATSTPISGCVQVGGTTVCGSTGGAQPKPPTVSAQFGNLSFGIDKILLIGVVVLVVVLVFRK